MTITARTVAPTPPRMDPLRRTALVAGTLYLVTFATSIPTLALYGPVHGADFILGSGSDTGVLVGLFLEVLLALSCRRHGRRAVSRGQTPEREPRARLRHRPGPSRPPASWSVS